MKKMESDVFVKCFCANCEVAKKPTDDSGLCAVCLVFKKKLIEAVDNLLLKGDKNERL